jgi:amino acid adenylation domain-containing protein
MIEIEITNSNKLRLSHQFHTPVERALLKIWNNFLQTSVASPDDNFFDLGGNQEIAQQIAEEIDQVFLLDIPATRLFQKPTIANQALCIEEIRAGKKAQAAVVLGASEAAKPTGIEQEAHLNNGHRGFTIPKHEEKQEYYPLSYSQERMWFIHQLQPDSSAYHVFISIGINGPLNIDALKQSFWIMTQHQESLRTVFQLKNGQPTQIILDQPTIHFGVHDLQAEPDETRIDQAKELIAKAVQEPFDLARLPLYRVNLYRLGGSEFILNINMHHIISDAWSSGVMFKEISHIYNALVDHIALNLPELPIKYSDYVLWQRNWMHSAEMNQQMDYWRQKLQGVSLLELPMDYPRPTIQTSHGATQAIELHDSLQDSLRRISSSHNATMFMCALAAFYVLLYRYTDQTDIAIGVPIANRNISKVEGLIGTFVNTLVMRNDLSNDPTFDQLLDRVKATALDAYAHQDLSFASLVADLQPDRDLSHSPLFQVMFNFINVPFQGVNLPGLETEYFEINNFDAQFDISCTLVTLPGINRILINYNTDLFKEETITRMMGHYSTILARISERTDTPISKLPLLSDSEFRQIITQLNETSASYPIDLCVTDLFENQARRSPDSIALSGKSLLLNDAVDITYRHLDRAANQLANYLRKLGVSHNTRVGISMKRNVEMLIGLLGIIKAGGTYVPFDPAFPPERLGYMFEDAQLSFLVTQQEVLSELQIPDNLQPTICLDRDWNLIANESYQAPEKDIEGPGLAYILYTSGSTGKPKGVMISHRSLTNFLCSMLYEPGITQNDVLLAVTTLSFDIAGLELFLPLISGARVVIADNETTTDGSFLLEKLISSNITIMQATPATWRMLIEAAWGEMPKLKMLCGGEALPRDLANQLLKRGGSLWNMYGPTETTIWSSTCEVFPGSSSIKLGRPIANTQFYVLDSHLQVLPLGIPGELFIAGDGVAAGYINKAELTREKFLPDPFIPGGRMYRTGDLVKRDSCGDLEFLGRADFQVKIRGFRVETGDVEAAILSNDRVRQSVVAAQLDASNEARLVCFYIPENEPSISAAELREYVKPKLPYYMIPSIFQKVNCFPLTPNGKVDRKALRISEDPEDCEQITQAATFTPIENDLAEIWQSLLNIKSIGKKDDFFALGGHSLLGAKLFAEIEKKYAIKIPLSTLFQSSTIEELAHFIEERVTKPQPIQDQHPLVTIQPEGNLPPFFCIHPIGGGVVGYYQLSQNLGCNQPFYGIEARPDDIHDPAMSHIKTMASKYILAIKTVQPKGPYYIGGYSYGGTIAYEMACQLQAQGETLGLVAMLDNPAPKCGYNNPRLSRKFFIGFYKNLSHWWNDFWEISSQERTGRIRRKLAQYKKKSLNNGEIDLRNLVDNVSPIPQDYQTLMVKQFQAYELYQPSPYQGRVTLFRTPRQPLFCSYDPYLEWEKLAKGGVELIMIEGSHRNILFEPFVKVLAEKLKSALSATQQ